jgi:hypothetical protein
LKHTVNASRMLAVVAGAQGSGRRKIGTWILTLLLGVAAGAGALAEPALATGGSYDTVISGVKVHIAEAEQSLTAGHSWTMGPSVLHLTGGSGGHLYMTNKHTGVTIWSAGDYPGANKILVFQTDGNLVLYNQGLHASWASNTWKQCKATPADFPYWGKVLGLQQDGNFVVYCRHLDQYGDKWLYQALWSTGTYCHAPGSDICDP